MKALQVACIFALIGSGTARAGWSPVLSLELEDDYGNESRAAAAADGSILLVRGTRAFLLKDRWDELPRLPKSAKDAGFDEGSTPRALVGEYESSQKQRLYLARLEAKGWQLSPPVLTSRSYAYFQQARMLQLGSALHVAAVDSEPLGCSMYSERLVATECKQGRCSDAGIIVEDSRSEQEYPYLTFLSLVRTPEREAAIIFADVRGTASRHGDTQRVVETLLPAGTVSRTISSESSRTSLDLAGAVSGDPLRLVGIQTNWLNGRQEVQIATRGKNQPVWTLSHFPLEDSIGSAFDLCRTSEAMLGVWSTPRPEALFYARLLEHSWSGPREVPGTRPGPSDTFDGGLQTLCTGSELHVVWSTYDRGLNHTVLAPLEVHSAEQLSDEIVLYGRGFSEGLEVRLAGQLLEVLELGPRLVRVKAPPDLGSRLELRNPDGEKAAFTLTELGLGSRWMLLWGFVPLTPLAAARVVRRSRERKPRLDPVPDRAGVC